MKYDLTCLNIVPSRLVSPESWVKHLPFAFFAVQILKPEVIVELGVHTGNSFCAFAEASTLFKTNTKLYGADTFEGEKHSGLYDDSIFTELTEYLRSHYNENVSLLRMKFEEAVTYFSDESIDILHIDGLHTYEAVKGDYDFWLNKVKKDGIILFHDTLVRRDNFGVWKLWEEIKTEHYFAHEFNYGHGLGLIALGNNPLVEELKRIETEMGIDNFFLPAGERNEWLYQFQKMRSYAEEQRKKFEYVRDVELAGMRDHRDQYKSLVDDITSKFTFKLYFYPIHLYRKFFKKH